MIVEITPKYLVHEVETEARTIKYQDALLLVMSEYKANLISFSHDLANFGGAGQCKHLKQIERVVAIHYSILITGKHKGMIFHFHHEAKSDHDLRTNGSLLWSTDPSFALFPSSTVMPEMGGKEIPIWQFIP